MKERRRDWASEVGSPCGANFAPQRIRAFRSNAFHDNPELLRLVPSSKPVRKQQQKKKRRINAACSASSISFLVFSRCSRPPPMAYVDHAFSISDEDIKMESPNVDKNRPPIKEISLAVSLLVFGSLGIVISVVMAVRDPRGTAEVRQPVSPTRGGWERGDQLGSDEWEREEIGDFFVSVGASAVTWPSSASLWRQRRGWRRKSH